MKRNTPLTESRTDVATSLIAGSGAGIISTLIMYPLEFLRTRLQQQSAAIATGPAQVLRGVINQGGGIRGLYTGLPLPLMAQSIYKANVFTVTGATQNVLRERRCRQAQPLSPLTTTEIFLSGAIAGAYNALLFVTPVEFVRNQLIQQPQLTTREVLRQALRQRQFLLPGLVLWRGASWSVVRDGLGCGFFFSSHALALDAIASSTNTSPSFAANVTAGALAGISFWLVALPLDTIKTWVQSSDMRKPPISVRTKLASIFHAEGAFGVAHQLLRGWQVAYGRGAPSAAITIASYTFLYQTLDDNLVSS